MPREETNWEIVSVGSKYMISNEGKSINNCEMFKRQHTVNINYYGISGYY